MNYTTCKASVFDIIGAILSYPNQGDIPHSFCNYRNTSNIELFLPIIFILFISYIDVSHSTIKFIPLSPHNKEYIYFQLRISTQTEYTYSCFSHYHSHVKILYFHQPQRQHECTPDYIQWIVSAQWYLKTGLTGCERFAYYASLEKMLV